jgi:acyl-CoA reductase-like NAD-dependent aldehyde dehydrogenase
MSTVEFEVTNPFNEQVVGLAKEFDEAEVDAVLTRAEEGFRGWSAVPVYQRAEIMKSCAQAVRLRREELGLLMASENGKPIKGAAGEILGVARKFESYAAEALRMFGMTIPGDAQAGYEHDLIYTRHEPYGVTVLITPFNFPLSLFSHKAAPAIAAGNVVVVKPSQFTPLSTIRLVEILHEAGLPENVCQVVTGTGVRAGAQLVEDPRVQLISLTGSTQTGVAVAQSAAKHLARVTLELGGNDPMIVLPDADLELAVDQAVTGRVNENGQCCAANKRFLIHSSIADEFAERVSDKLSRLSVGDQLDPSIDIGPLIHSAAADRAAAQVRDMTDGGAQLLFGDGRARGAVFGPQVITGVDATMAVAHDEEIFAPVFPIIRFERDDEAVALANNTIYGLHSSVFSKDLSRALRVANRLEAGLVAVNGTGNYKPDAIPFGGYKMSGLGREGVTAMISQFTQVKTIALRNAL